MPNDARASEESNLFELFRARRRKTKLNLFEHCHGEKRWDEIQGNCWSKTTSSHTKQLQFLHHKDARNCNYRKFIPDTFLSLFQRHEYM